MMKNNAWIMIPGVILVAVGVALAGSQGSVKAANLPVFALGIGLAFIIQWLAFIPAYLLRTEKFFDLVGSLSYITIITVSVLLIPNPGARAWLLFGMVIIWAGRLGTFLFLRILKAGKDSRFERIKTEFLRFLSVWTIQGLWISLTLSAALAAVTSKVQKPLGIPALIGGLIWGIGFIVEALADEQKRQFKANPENEGRFIHSGLWAWSRHPNYFGEIMIWIGVMVIALPVLRGWQFVSLISPVFVILLLTRISGIPLLEEKADKRWGGQDDYEAYKKRTPVLVPRPPKRE